jgi:RHH-type proline utilization regulon transcriptional repressor/proline dehydrogenase/delta 1-pyrroline-5-carboxylate dehydrogenase
MIEMLRARWMRWSLGDPWDLDTDVGPVIDAEAQADIAAYIDDAQPEGRLLKRLDAPGEGTFVGPR